MANYDEDLTENLWFNTLITKHKKLHEKATSNRYVICIPKVESWTYESSDELQSNAEIFESHIFKEDSSNNIETCSTTDLSTKSSNQVNWVTFNGKVVYIDDSTIQLPGEENHFAQILFEEIFFNSSDESYKILCISRPLLSNIAAKDAHFQSENQPIATSKLKNLSTVFLYSTNASRSKSLIDNLIALYLKNARRSSKVSHAAEKRRSSQQKFSFELGERSDLANCKHSVQHLFNNCMQSIFKDVHLKKSVEENGQLLELVKTEVQTYMYYEIFGCVFRQISDFIANEESKFNKITQNLNKISPRHLEIDESFWLSLPKAKRCLQRINRFYTASEKLNCVKQACQCITSNNNVALSSDDLLPIFVYLLIKCNIPNWLSNKIFIEHFEMLDTADGNSGFYMCTFEAAVEYIKSGQANKLHQASIAIATAISAPNSFDECAQAISSGNIAYLRQILEQSKKMKSQQEKKMCHPLCACKKCIELKKSEMKQSDEVISPKSKNDKGQTLLHIAALNGHHEIVECLLKYGCNVNVTDYHGSSPLHVAAASGAQSAMFLLLYYGANATAVDNNSNTALHICCQNGHDACVKALLFFDPSTTVVNVNAPNDSGDTPLHIAAKWGYEDIVNVLIEYGANVNAKNRSKKTPLDLSNNYRVSTALQNSDDAIQLVLDLRHLQTNKESNQQHLTSPSAKQPHLLANTHSTSVTTASKDKPSVDKVYATKQIEKLLKAVSDNDINMVKFLCGWNSSKNTKEQISAKCHPLCQCSKCQPNSHEHILHANSSNNENYTGLLISAKHGFYMLAKLFIDNGADLNTSTARLKYTALHFACEKGCLEIVKELLSKRCKIDIRDSAGNTPLYMACIYNHTECAKELMKHGASVNIRNREGDSPLHLAVKWKNTEIIKLLIENDAIAYYKNHDGVTPVDLSGQSPEIKDVLLNSIVQRERAESDLEWSLIPEATRDGVKNEENDVQIEDVKYSAQVKPGDKLKKVVQRKELNKDEEFGENKDSKIVVQTEEIKTETKFHNKKENFAEDNAAMAESCERESGDEQPSSSVVNECPYFEIEKRPSAVDPSDLPSQKNFNNDSTFETQPTETDTYLNLL